MSTVPDAIPKEDEEPPQAVSAPDASSPAALVVPAEHAVQALDETYSSTKHVRSHETQNATLVPSDPGPHEQSRVPPLL